MPGEERDAEARSQVKTEAEIGVKQAAGRAGLGWRATLEAGRGKEGSYPDALERRLAATWILASSRIERVNF